MSRATTRSQIRSAEQNFTESKLITYVIDEVKKLESQARPDAQLPLHWRVWAVRDFTKGLVVLNPSLSHFRWYNNL